jgi:hypothetical protein
LTNFALQRNAIRVFLKTQKPRIAIKVKAEFSEVNKHFAEGAKRQVWGF